MKQSTVTNGMNRRAFLKKLSASLFATPLAAVSLAAAQVEPRDVQITGLELTPVFSTREMGRTGPADPEKSVSNHVLVRLKTKPGIMGLGEMSDINWSVERPSLRRLHSRLESLLVGRSPLDLGSLQVALEKESWDHQVQAGVEIALYDLLGKALGLPVYQLFGGRVRQSIPFAYPLAPCRSEADVTANLKRIEGLLGHGHPAIRYYFGADLDRDEQLLSEMRKRWGERVRLVALDASGRFEVSAAIRAIGRLAQFSPGLVESPVKGRHRAPAADFLRVREAVTVPIGEHIASDEVASRLSRPQAVDVFNTGPAYGGFHLSRRIFAVARVFGIQALMGSTVELSIGTAGRAHLAATLPNLEHGCYMAGPLVYEERICKERVDYRNGEIFLSDRPGLGLELDPALLAAQTL